jgi:hypothetical protein
VNLRHHLKGWNILMCASQSLDECGRLPCPHTSEDKFIDEVLLLLREYFLEIVHSQTGERG